MSVALSDGSHNAKTAPANFNGNTNGFCRTLNQTLAASLNDRQKNNQLSSSVAMIDKSVAFIPSRTLPLEKCILEKFKNLSNSSILENVQNDEGKCSSICRFCSRLT